jgi:cation-transporting ATPase 13A3/4/5
MASQGGITIASNNLIRSNPIIHRHGNYNALSEDSGQEILVDDDLTFYISGRKTSQTRYICFVLVNLLTLGLVSLASKWYPNLEMIFKTEASSLENANILAIKNQYNELSLVQVGLIRLEQTPFCKVFPKHVHNTLLNSVKYFEYRYFGFLFNPEINQFEPIYGWRDPEWTSTKNILSNPTTFSKFKQVIFGSNQIDIKSRSDFQILVDEVLHPFFVFQIASIILWSMDEYYYYAACIFIISVVSTTITFYETKENLKRMRGLAKFSCHTIVWRENTWKAILSEDLVPGDIFQFKSGDMQLFPCDAVLLTGDCIVNESINELNQAC